MRPKAEWAIDSEPIRARGIIVKYSIARGKYDGVDSLAGIMYAMGSLSNDDTHNFENVGLFHQCSISVECWQVSSGVEF